MRDNFWAMTLVGAVVVIGIFALFAWSQSIERAERECRNRGGQVIHYGQYGTGVDCVFVGESE